MQELKDFLEKIPAKWHTRKIQMYPSYILYLDSIFPNVPLNIQIHSFVHGISPYCSVCGSPIKSLGKRTCSVSCRTKFEKDNNLVEKRLEKSQETIMLRYGVSNPAKSSEIQGKRLTTMVERYGSKVSDKAREATTLRAHEMNIKSRITLKEKYGVDNPGQLDGHGEKCKKTLLENYGVDHYSKSSEFKLKNLKDRWNSYRELSPPSIEICNISIDEDKEKIFENPNRIIEFLCECGHEDSAPSETYKWRIRETLTPCIKCSGLNKGSKKEKDVKNFVESLGFTVVENKKSLEGKEIDIFVPERNIGIEFNGLFYHNDLKVDKNYHIDKSMLAYKQGIQLIHIFEDEWDYRREIVKSRLSNILGKTSNKIYARKCEVKEISLLSAKAFIEENHIQGYANSSVKLGLFFEGELVSVMTFCIPGLSKGQKAEKDFWELSRFCSLINTNVIGAPSKLLKYFEKTYKPKKLLSFADKRWSNGDLYSKLGFEECQDTSINYWYIMGGKRIHRFELRKNKDDDQELTEYENRINQGYKRIWDCGSKKFLKLYD